MRSTAIVALSACLAFATTALPVGPALAGVKEQAAEAYGLGAKAFKAKDFKTALGHFDRAFKLDPSPILLYNIARCHEEMGALDPAISNFKLYLVKAPDSQDREDVERRVRVMEAIKRRQAAAPPSEPASVGSTARPAGDDAMQWWGYGLLGAGVVGLALGGGFGLAADDAAEKHRAATTRADKSSFEDDANSKATLANASYVVGGILALAGASIVVWDLVSGGGGVEVTPVPAAGGGGGVLIRATF